jgi:hypothetical protein
MKRTYLFFILFTSTLVVAMEYQGPFKDFVSRWRDSKLAERVSGYRAKFDDLVKQGDIFAAEELVSEMARQGDFESLDLLEKNLPPDLKKAVWQGVASKPNTDDAKKLLVKWAKENPTVPILMQYHPKGMDLLIEMAEDKNARVEDRVYCLRILAYMPAATKVIDRIKALKSDQSKYSDIQPDIIEELSPQYSPPTLGRVASETVDKLMQR